MYTHIYTSKYIYIYFIHICIYLYIYIYIYVCIYIYVYMCMRTFMYIYTWEHICIYIHTYRHHVRQYTYKHINIDVYTNTLIAYGESPDANFMTHIATQVTKSLSPELLRFKKLLIGFSKKATLSLTYTFCDTHRHRTHELRQIPG